jgi:hypothetical protein
VVIFQRTMRLLRTIATARVIAGPTAISIVIATTPRTGELERSFARPREGGTQESESIVRPPLDSRWRGNDRSLHQLTPLMRYSSR